MLGGRSHIVCLCTMELMRSRSPKRVVLSKAFSIWVHQVSRCYWAYAWTQLPGPHGNGLCKSTERSLALCRALCRSEAHRSRLFLSVCLHTTSKPCSFGGNWICLSFCFRFLYESSMRTLGEFLNSWQNHHLWGCRNRKTLGNEMCVYLPCFFKKRCETKPGGLSLLGPQPGQWLPRDRAQYSTGAVIHTVPLINSQR